MSNRIIEVSQLSKTYKEGTEAVKNISFSVKEGEFFAFLGPNGAGKSTTIKMLTTLMKPTFGEGKIAGYDLLQKPEKIRLQIGVALQNTAIDPALTGRELIILQGRLFGFSKAEAIKRAKELLELVGLTKDADKQCGKYSGGMQRRLDLAMTLVHRPKVLFLDEPTVGLDPASRMDLWQEIKKLNKEYGTTIFLTTQYLEEADEVADRVGIINDGEIVALEKPEALKSSLMLDKIKLFFRSIQEKEKAQKAMMEITSNLESLDNQIILHLQKNREYLPVILGKLAAVHVFPIDIQIASPTLDDVFLQIIRDKKSTNENRGV
ncbi:ABC-2 type transport system ATP-binding protein [Natronincola peptidivorans]|uniref:ABC-2 type transport system ATP-binding protein n=1 Tax=Natronincola peptidivorans TaxID=426128 RepID=A0A1I0DQ11_9FIRM|nr:ATP-binding cassette domain-containing protein [Natronincola peptidivorans]SET34612.1 ABC-2 type transport system ATP-binding protein [Natronincola peptidivorans]